MQLFKNNSNNLTRMMKIFFFWAIICPLNLFCQNDTIIYYSRLCRTITSSDSAYFYDKVEKKSKNEYLLSTYSKEDNKWNKNDENPIKFESNSSVIIKSKGSGKEKTTRYFTRIDSGYLIKEYTGRVLSNEGYTKLIFPLIKSGYWKYFYYPTGNLKVETYYSDNQTITNKFYVYGNYIIKDVFSMTDKKAEYEGGMENLLKYVAEHCNYPLEAKERNITGRVIVGIIVMKDGSVDGVHLIKGANPILDLEAIRVASSIPDKFIPAEINNEKVNMLIAIPVTFQIIISGKSGRY